MALIISKQDVLSNVDYGRTINQLIDLFIKPELEKLKVGGFKAAAIEMFDDGRDRKVYFEDLIVSIETKTPKFEKEDVGRQISLSLKDIKSIKLVEDNFDPNSAKVFLLKWGKDDNNPDYWILEFDFRYNKQLARNKLNRAKEFLDAASNLDFKRHFNVLIYLIWSALELILDMHLLLIPGQKITSKKHGERQEKIKQFPITTVSEIGDLFQAFSKNKDYARYADGKNDFPDIDSDFIKKTLKKLTEDVKKIAL